MPLESALEQNAQYQGSSKISMTNSPPIQTTGATIFEDAGQDAKHDNNAIIGNDTLEEMVTSKSCGAVSDVDAELFLGPAHSDDVFSTPSETELDRNTNMILESVIEEKTSNDEESELCKTSNVVEIQPEPAGARSALGTKVDTNPDHSNSRPMNLAAPINSEGQESMEGFAMQIMMAQNCFSSSSSVPSIVPNGQFTTEEVNSAPHSLYSAVDPAIGLEQLSEQVPAASEEATNHESEDSDVRVTSKPIEERVTVIDIQPVATDALQAIAVKDDANLDSKELNVLNVVPPIENEIGDGIPLQTMVAPGCVSSSNSSPYVGTDGLSIIDEVILAPHSLNSTDYAGGFDELVKEQMPLPSNEAVTTCGSMTKRKPPKPEDADVRHAY